VFIASVKVRVTTCLILDSEGRHRRLSENIEGRELAASIS
jgi:hypothetical protein